MGTTVTRRTPSGGCLGAPHRTPCRRFKLAVGCQRVASVTRERGIASWAPMHAHRYCPLKLHRQKQELACHVCITKPLALWIRSAIISPGCNKSCKTTRTKQPTNLLQGIVSSHRSTITNTSTCTILSSHSATRMQREPIYKQHIFLLKYLAE